MIIVTITGHIIPTSCAFINYVRKTWVHVVIRRSKLEYNQEPISQITLTIEGKCAIC